MSTEAEEDAADGVAEGRRLLGVDGVGVAILASDAVNALALELAPDFFEPLE